MTQAIMLQVEAHAMRVNLNRGYEFAAPLGT